MPALLLRVVRCTPRSPVALVAALVLTACEHGTSAPPVAPSAAASIASLTVSHSAIALPLTWNGIVNVGVVRQSGFTAPIALAIDSVPSGVTATFATPVLSVDASGTKLDLDVSDAAKPGVYFLLIRANAGPQLLDRVTLRLEVPPPSILMRPAASALSAEIDGPAVIMRVTISRLDAYRGPVRLSLEGGATGVQAVLSPAVLPADATVAQLTVQASTAASLGSVLYTIRATGDNVAPQVAQLPVTITPHIPLLILAATPPVVDASLGKPGTTTISGTLKRGYEDWLWSYAVGPMPTGVRATANVSSGLVRFDIDSSAVLGTYPIAIFARWEGDDTTIAATTTVTLRVVKP